MTTPYFRTTPTGLAPGPIARSPWSADMLHGRLIGGAAARALETEFGAAGWRAGRLTVDLFRPAAMAELRIATTAVREGRRIRVADFASAERGRVWTNDTAPLVDDEEMSPFVRAAVSADIACPMANGSDEGLHYINGDYTLALGRYPVGPWIGLQVSNQIAADGISVGSCVLVDRHGPFATSTGSSLATAPLEDPG